MFPMLKQKQYNSWAEESVLLPYSMQLLPVYLSNVPKVASCFYDHLNYNSLFEAPVGVASFPEKSSSYFQVAIAILDFRAACAGLVCWLADGSSNIWQHTCRCHPVRAPHS